MYYEFEKRKNPVSARECVWTLSPIPQIHPHLELIYLTEGSGYATADNHTEILNPRDLYLAFPNQIHYYDAIPANGILVIVSPELFPDLLDIFNCKLPDSPIIRREPLPPDAYAQLQRICRCVKAADKLCAYLKCVEEYKNGNNEFKKALESSEKIVTELGERVPEVKWFMENVASSYEKSIDEL